VKAKRGDVDRALRAPAETLFFLFHGPDEAGSQALVRALAAAAGAGAERIDLTGAELKSDPARLADEAASLSLFGGARYIIVDPAGDESLAAVEALLQAPAAGNPVAIVAGTLKPTSKLLKLATAEPRAIAFASYVPEGRDADRLVVDMARKEGLTVRGDVARRIAEGAAGNRSVMASEIAKYAAYLDAAPDRPRALEHEAVDALGAGAEEGDLGRLVDSIVEGDPKTLEAEVLRRMLLLAQLRGDVERGSAVPAVMASPAARGVFWKEKDAVARQLARWRSTLIARSIGRLLEAERQMKASGALGPVAVQEELFAICRQAQRLR
jgi:DNA polymerase-3 subunit delta